MYTWKFPLSLMFIAILLSLAACKGTKGNQQKPSADKELPEALAEAYREDAARLAVRELRTTNQTGERGAEIPQDRIDYYYGLLSKVYWLTVKSDTIPDLSGIHTLKTPSLRQVLVILEKDSPFKENWSKGITLTSNLYLNQLIAKHKLVIKNYRETGIGPTLDFESPYFLNMPELAFLIKNFETIRSAEAEGMAGDGNDITFGSDSKNALALKYSIGAGDCPSGCIQRKTWIFYILPDGSISYMGTRGTIPKEMEPK
jgi:hypothetical protein